MEIAVWILTLGLTLIGLLGVILPLLPGTTLILVAMIAHKLLLPGSLSGYALGWIAAVWALSVLIDFGGVLIGTRLFGGSRWGLAGASGGALLGMFFSLPCPDYWHRFWRRGGGALRGEEDAPRLPPRGCRRGLWLCALHGRPSGLRGGDDRALPLRRRAPELGCVVPGRRPRLPRRRLGAGGLRQVRCDGLCPIQSRGQRPRLQITPPSRRVRLRNLKSAIENRESNHLPFDGGVRMESGQPNPLTC